MLIGNTSRFAVQLDLDENHGGPWLYGRFCYWIGGTQVGSHQLGTSLRDVLFQLPTILRDRGHRTDSQLFGIAGEALHARLCASLFGAEPIPDHAEALKDEWARFNIKLPVDVFDGCFVFVVEDPPRARVLFTTDRAEKVGDVSLRAGEVDEILLAVYRDLDTLHQRETEGSGSSA